jgi:hypothetical protein
MPERTRPRRRSRSNSAKAAINDDNELALRAAQIELQTDLSD